MTLFNTTVSSSVTRRLQLPIPSRVNLLRLGIFHVPGFPAAISSPANTFVESISHTKAIATYQVDGRAQKGHRDHTGKDIGIKLCMG